MFDGAVPNTGTYAWTVPNVSSSACLVAAVETSGGSIYDIGNATFTITTVNTALQFDGINDRVEVADNSALDLTNSWTIEAWYRKDGGSSNQSIVEKYGWAAGGGGYLLRIVGDKATVGVTESASGNTVTGATTLSTGVWYHLAGTFDAATNTLKVYVNGVLDGTSTSATLNPTAGATNLKIGARGDDSGNLTTGAIDGVRIWNVVRSESEIANYMDVCDLTGQNGLVASYDFQDGTGMSTLTDIQSGYNGTLYNMDASTDWIQSGYTCVPQSSVATLQITYPNGGESLSAGSGTYIYWNASNITYLEMYYSTDGGANWIFVADGIVASNGYYYWTVPSVASTNCLIRLNDMNTSVSDQSNSVFTITQPYYTLTSPNGGETFASGSTQNITWAATTFPSNYANLFYSVDGGANWTLIGWVYVYNYSYSWTVPNNISCNVLIKMEDYYTAQYPDQSDATFCIEQGVPSVTLTTPDGGNNLAGGTNSYIYWTAANMSTVQLEYSTDGGANWILIATNISASGGSYLWSVPNTPSSNCLVRVTDEASATSDVSNTVFSIYQTYYTITSPNGGELWEANSGHYVYWSGTYPSSYVNLYYSIDGGASWTMFANAAYAYNNYYYWTLPSNITCDALVKIEDYYYPSITDVSNATFCIQAAAPSLTLTQPNGGDYWQSNSYQYIYWSASNVSTVELEYTTDGGSTWTLIANNITASNGYYYWYVPSTPSTNCYVRVNDEASSATDISNSAFTIYTPYITLTTPNGGESWESGTYQYIYWNGVYPSSYVSLYYSVDGGANWTYISWAYANNGYYQWFVPNNVGCNVMIKIEDYYNSAFVDMSASTFCITQGVPSLSINYPNGGETYAVGSYQYLSWYATNVTTVTIEYSTDGGSTWTLIDDNYSSVDQTNYYYWLIPNAPSSNCYFRVTDNASATTAQNFNPFTIAAPYLQVTYPNGGETFTGGNATYIYWTGIYPSSYVNLYYSTDNGLNWTYIGYTNASNGYYYWTFPNVESCNALIKVEDYNNSTYFDVSDATFCLQEAPATITVNSPNGFETWPVGSGKYITWSSTSVDNVKIELSTDGGTTWTTIAASVAASSGSYYVIVPNTPSSNCYVRVSDVDDANVYDWSNYYFYIVTPSITVTTPNGGEVYTAGSGYYIYWSSSSISNYVRILYSIDGGASWSYVTSSSYNYGYYYWTVPNTPSTNCLVKIEDYYNSSIVDVSNSVFTINEAPPSITVNYPNGGESFAIGSTKTITWSATSVDNVKIEYSIDGGSTFNTIVNNYNASIGSYNWVVPNSPSSYCYVRITDASNSSVYDWSNSYFSIVNPSITVTYPNGGETFTGLSSYYVYWNSTGVSSYVRIEYSIDGGSTWSTASSYAYNYGYYYWTVPNVTSSNCLLKVTDYYSNQVYDVSNSTFTINAAAATLVLTEPNGGEVFGQGSYTYIQWNSSQVSNVNLYYSVDGGSNWISIASGVTSNGYYYWTVPNESSSYCLVKVEDASNSSFYDISNSYFTIQAPYIYVSTPNGGETYTVGDYQYVYWSSTAASSYVKIEISTDGGTTYTTLANSTYNDGSYGYYVPNTPSTTCMIKVSDYNATSYYDVSNGYFTIQQAPPSVALTSPNGGEVYAKGTTANITWTSTSVANVQLEYSTDGGLTWVVIVSSTPSDGSYIWTVPNTLSDEYMIKVSDASSSGALYDISNGYFEVAAPYVTVSTPNGGESYQVGTNKYITWTSLGMNYVTIEYSVDGGTTYNNIVTNLANSGYYNWTVPNNLSTNCLVRVKSVGLFPPISDVSDAVFSIVAPTPVITLTSPNGGEVWYTGYNYYIGWSSTAISNVKLEYSTDGGTDWTVISNSHPAAGGFFYWNVPNDPSTTCRVRVSDASNTSVTDMSNYNFTIATPTPSVQVTYPNGGETLYQGSYKYVTWTRNFVNEVNAYYSTDNGSSWNTLATNLNSNYIYWNVPVVSSTNCLIRVEQFGNASVADQSDAVFTIEAPFVNTNTLAIDTIMSIPFCKEDTIEVAYIATGTFNTGNTFTVQLSDSLGSFAYPSSIGSLESVDLVDTIACVVPASIGNGDGYRIRVVADDYTTVGADNGADILISSPEFDFVADEVIKYIPNSEVDFTYIGETADIDSLAWDFGDNGASDVLNPSHTYGDIGFYDVKLTVIDNNGCAITENKASYMRIERLFLSTPLTTNTSYNVTGLAFSNTNIGLGCISLEDGNCLITSDSGNTWVPSVTGVAGMLSGAAIVPGAWFVTGQNGQINSTANQGATWTSHYTGTNENFNASAFTSATNGFAVGTNGTVYHYDGTDWTSQSSGVSSHLNSVAATGTTAFAVGNGGAMIYYNGSSWSTLTSGTTADLTGIFMYDANKGYVVGTGGTILSWNGTTWSVSLSGLDIDFTSVAINGTDTAWAAGTSGIIYRTYDGGNTWARYSIGSTNKNNGIVYKKAIDVSNKAAAAAANRGYVVGNSGDARRFDSGGDPATNPDVAVKSTEAAIMNFRAYPNPTTDYVVFETVLQHEEKLVISIKNMEGKEVMKVNNSSYKGPYRKEVSVAGLANGVYFVHVNQGANSWVQKLVVTK